MIGIGNINAVILEINEHFLIGKAKIGAELTADSGINIFKYRGKICNKVTIEEDLSFVAAYAYLEGFKLGMYSLKWD